MVNEHVQLKNDTLKNDFEMENLKFWSIQLEKEALIRLYTIHTHTIDSITQYTYRDMHILYFILLYVHSVH